jgi:hypothetical protein
MGTNLHFNEGGGMGFAATGSERQTAVGAVALLWRQVDCLVRNGQMFVAATAVAGAAMLLTTAAARRGRGRVEGGRVVGVSGWGIG